MNSTTLTATVCKLREIFAQHGLLELLVSDNAPNSTVEEFEIVMRKNGVVHITSAPYHPASHGLAESGVQIVKSGITKTVGDNVETKLQRFLFDYRRTLQSTTGKSPMEVLNQRKMRFRLDLLHPSLQGKLHKKQIQVKYKHNSKRHERKFPPREIAYVKNFGPGLKWLIGTIIHVTGPVSYGNAVALHDGRECRRYVDRLRSRRADSDSMIPMCQRGQVDTDTEIAPCNHSV